MAGTFTLILQGSKVYHAFCVDLDTPQQLSVGFLNTAALGG